MTKISEVWTVRRNINIPGLINRDKGFIIKQALSELKAIQEITTDRDKLQITLTYDSSQLNYQTITQLLKNSGMAPLNNWWCRLKEACYQYMDSNARENAHAAPAACCNKPPQNLKH